MPAAELFGSWAVAEAAADAMERRPRAVIAVGDCDPAAGALNAATSRVRQMRQLLEGARALTPHWLAVSVARESNTDADLLSHPERLPLVLAGAEAAGLRPRVAAIPERCWEVLRAAMQQRGAEEEARPAKQRRRR
eukprot:4994304-Pleurochrysis_carterae.AAC.1